MPARLAARAGAGDISGRIVPGRAGGEVVVQRRTATGWSDVEAALLDTGGFYRVTVRASGLYRVRSGTVAGPAVRVAR
jgi:hypothetical protein